MVLVSSISNFLQIKLLWQMNGWGFSNSNLALRPSLYILSTMIFKRCTQTLTFKSNISYSIVTIFLSGALSLTAITFNRVIGIAMPRLANMLEMNRYIVYAILAFIWIVSLGTAVPTFDYRRYNVSSLNLCLHTACHMDHRKLHQVNFVSVYQALGK